MKIPEEVRKTVSFIGYRDQQDASIKPVGSAFFLGLDPEKESTVSTRVFVVTARHVIEGLRNKGCKTCILRLNPSDIEKEIISTEIAIDDWIFHPSDPSVDVAVAEQGIPPGVDHLVLPLNLGGTKEKLTANEVDLGDEVFVSGLFVHHFGRRRNIPIVRIGNLAAMDEEKIQTKRGLIDAYLIEARSIGGLSGSPVFLNLGSTRFIGGSIKHNSNGISFFLLGLIHGHFDSSASGDLLLDNATEDERKASVNAGIAIVVPFEKIREVINYALIPKFNLRKPGIYTGGWGAKV